MAQEVHDLNEKRDELLQERSVLLDAHELTVEDVDVGVKRHISLLHEYNEMKDAAQTLLGTISDTHFSCHDMYDD